MKKKKLNDEIVEKIVKHFHNGEEYKEIAIFLNISKTTVYRVLKLKKLKNADRVKLHKCNFDLKEIGNKYNYLTIIGTEYNDNLKTWCAKCVCDCGRETIDTLRKVKNGEKKTCGSKDCQFHLDLIRMNGSLGTETTGYKDILGSVWAIWRLGAKKRKIDFMITMEDTWDIFENQNKKCALTGIPLKFRKGMNREQTASLDRIDSAKPYTKDNVQWVHKEINRMKGALLDDEFIEYCKKVVLWNKN